MIKSEPMSARGAPDNDPLQRAASPPLSATFGDFEDDLGTQG